MYAETVKQPFFGEPWPSGICDEGEQVPTPVGHRCSYCMETIEEGDRGTWWSTYTPVHAECNFRAVFGGIGHHVDHRKYCLGELGTDAGLTKRQSSKLVWALNQGAAVIEEDLEQLRRENAEGRQSTASQV